MRTSPVFVIVALATVTCFSPATEPPKLKPAAELPEIKGLPNPFTFSDGSPVRTVLDWEKRRLELKNLFQDYEYGHLPANPKAMTVVLGKLITDDANKVTIQEHELKLANDDKTMTMRLRLVMPQDAKGPVPVVIQSGFRSEERRVGKECW